MDKSNLNLKQFGSDGEGKYVKKVGGRGKRNDPNNDLQKKYSRASKALNSHLKSQHPNKAPGKFGQNCDTCGDLAYKKEQARQQLRGE
jgi:hypothetical protein